MPLHDRRPGRGLAWPGHGEGATAGQGIRHEEHAGDRLEPEIAPGKAAGSYLVGLLDDLGYRASLHAVSNDQFCTDIYNPRLKIQVSIGAGWGADFPAPSTFFGPLLSCQSADEPGTNNWAGFCDPHVDTLASQAQAAQLTDPAAARKLWAQADRIVTDQAPYVPIHNRPGRIRLLPGPGTTSYPRCTGPCSTRCGSDDGEFHGQTSLRATGFAPERGLQTLPAILNPGEDRYDETSEQQSDSYVIIKITVRDTYMRRYRPEICARARADYKPFAIKIVMPWRVADGADGVTGAARWPASGQRYEIGRALRS